MWTIKFWRDGKVYDQASPARQPKYQALPLSTKTLYDHIPRIGEKVRVDQSSFSYMIVPVLDVQYDFKNNEVHVYLGT